jgi:hypothetical protein
VSYGINLQSSSSINTVFGSALTISNNGDTNGNVELHGSNFSFCNITRSFVITLALGDIMNLNFIGGGGGTAVTSITSLSGGTNGYDNQLYMELLL